MRSVWCACGQRVRWALTANQKWLAIGLVPDPAGNQAAYRDGTGRWVTRQLREGEEPYGYERRYLPHAAACTARRKPQEAPPLPENVIPIGRAPSRQRGARPQPKGT